MQCAKLPDAQDDRICSYTYKKYIGTSKTIVIAHRLSIKMTFIVILFYIKDSFYIKDYGIAVNMYLSVCPRCYHYCINSDRFNKRHDCKLF